MYYHAVFQYKGFSDNVFSSSSFIAWIGREILSKSSNLFQKRPTDLLLFKRSFLYLFSDVNVLKTYLTQNVLKMFLCVVKIIKQFCNGKVKENTLNSVSNDNYCIWIPLVRSSAYRPVWSNPPGSSIFCRSLQPAYVLLRGRCFVQRSPHALFFVFQNYAPQAYHFPYWRFSINQVYSVFPEPLHFSFYQFINSPHFLNTISNTSVFLILSSSKFYKDFNSLFNFHVYV